MRRFAGLMVVLVLSLAASAGAWAAEEIRNFRADITVNADASLDVTETITVNAEGYDIRRGIFRDIPVRALDDWGLWSTNGLEILEVLHDGEDTAFRTETQGRFLRIYIGDPDVLIARGEHTYTIRYVTTRQLRYFGDYDELYWNVTGNFWSFPILNAEAVVHLPEGAQPLQVEAYTGAYGAETRNYAASKSASNVRVSLTRPLGPEEGLTIAVGFTPGVVAPDGAGAVASLTANAGIALIILVWLGVPIYLVNLWNRIGRDPPAPPIIPLFHPPENLSPAALSFAHFNGFRTGRKGVDMPFVAALLSLGVKRFLVIDEDERKRVTIRPGPMATAADRPALPGGEAALFKGLLGGRQEMALTKANGTSLQSAVAALRRAISSEYEDRYYKSNLGRVVLVAVVAVAALIGGIVLQDPPEEGILYLIPVLMTSLFGGGLGFAGFSLWREPGLGSRILGPGLMLLGAAVFLIGVLVVLPDGLPVYRLAGAVLLVGIATLIAMVWLIGAPTETGAKVLADIKGFKLYLETAETNRLNLRDAPELSEELFERFLPYAVGLGVEKPWSDAWAAQLKRIAPEEARAYQPRWYHGSSWSPGDIGRAASTSVAAVSAAMASSMPQPKSSSGSSGGGFSGGGGGGGGGGGW
ncbi:DUF2207 domain-containing protein [Hoeflea olei]|uniref:DUF2207 domain-containing protein n=1 Tax=Hoeflea olei TaxID=1480615 RepID=A0A1C1YPU7_9HYPH|nr:DUF2207 domain-containing protein [Hoeflea olei]OCW55583.1 hypothetical protein AWJ14_06235 [Hoeflea olei]